MGMYRSIGLYGQGSDEWMGSAAPMSMSMSSIDALMMVRHGLKTMTSATRKLIDDCIGATDFDFAPWTFDITFSSASSSSKLVDRYSTNSSPLTLRPSYPHYILLTVPLSSPASSSF